MLKALSLPPFSRLIHQSAVQQKAETDKASAISWMAVGTAGAAQVKPRNIP